jgi:ABC-2 type transport system permease protein
VNRYLRLAALQLRLSLAEAMAYRSDFVIQGVISLAWIAVALLPYLVLFDDRPVIAGDWDAASALVVMSYFLGINAVLVGVVSPSVTSMIEQIRSGAFDYVLLKPVDAQLLVSTSRYEPWRIFDLLGAIGLCVYAFHLRGYPPAAADILVGVLLFFSGTLAMYAMWIACAALSFWVVRLDNLAYLLGAIYDTGRWPVQVFRGIWRVVFTAIIPVALMTTFPAMALLGRLDATTALATAGGTLLLLVLSRLLWRAAIRSYTSASS